MLAGTSDEGKALREAARRPRPRRHHERRDGDSSRQCSRSSARRSGSRPATYEPAGPTPSVNGSHHSSKLGCSTLDRQRRLLDLAQPGGLEQLAPGALRGRPPARTRPSTSGSSSRAASQNRLSGPARRRDPRRTLRRHRPAGSRAPSRPVPRAGSDMKWTTSCARAASNARPGTAAAPPPRGARRRRDGAPDRSDERLGGSTADTAAGPPARPARP